MAEEEAVQEVASQVMLARLDERTRAIQMQMQQFGLTVTNLQTAAQTNANRITVIETADRASTQDVSDLKSMISTQAAQIETLKSIISSAQGALSAWKWIVGFVGINTLVLAAHVLSDIFTVKP